MCNKNNLFASSIVEHNIPPHHLINQPYKPGCSFTFDATHSAGYSPAFKIFLKHLANFLIVILVTTRNDFLCFPTACMETLSSLGTKSSTNSDHTVPSPHLRSRNVSKSALYFLNKSKIWNKCFGKPQTAPHCSNSRLGHIV